MTTNQPHDDDKAASVSPTPAGGGGADSGAAPAVAPEGRDATGDEASSQNDIAGVGPRGGEPDDVATQDAPLEDQNSTTLSEEVRGILVQTRADIQLGNAREDQVRDILSRRLRDAGLADDVDLDALVREVESPSDDDTSPGVHP
ncbi:hypothetical protein HDC37_001534 [Microbacterium sp. AK009]|uniref:hypothetical protein n=1 Tax=Microbacterium sp. AK009 TaxID=2723068 RepID=UPI0015C6E3AE|nr:hypothetical protein [Microbacterium sp. AK009]NYF16709.1 hypothetical protein [Microbacterium sp. AK009]